MIVEICAAVGVLLVIIGILMRRRRAGPLLIASGVISLILTIFLSPEMSQTVVDGITWILDGGQPGEDGS